MTYLPEETKYVNLVPPLSYSSAAVSAVYVSMAKYDHVDFVLQFGVLASIASDVVTMMQAASTSGSSSSTLAVNGYYHNRTALASASIANDLFTRVPYSSMSSSGKTFKLAGSSSNQVYVIPVDADMLSQASNLKAAGIAIATIGGVALLGIHAILSKPRYARSSPPSAL